MLLNTVQHLTQIKVNALYLIRIEGVLVLVLHAHVFFVDNLQIDFVDSWPHLGNILKRVM